MSIFKSKPAPAPIQPPPPTPLPIADSDPAVLRQVAAEAAKRRAKNSWSSTLISGQMGDVSAPPVSAPLVTGG